MMGASVSAKQAMTPPQQAPIAKVHHHGVHEEHNERAPTAKSQYKPTLQLAKRSKAAKAIAASCNTSAFATSNSTSLINEIKSQGASCVNDLFSADSTIQQSVFSSDNMFAVANHVKTLSTNYAGGGDPDIEAMFLYLRAGFFVEFYNDSVNLASWVRPAVKGALDAFVNNANFYQNNDAHGKTLGEVITTMDSSEYQDVYLPVVKQWLSRWNESYASSWNMRSAVNGIFTILFRGQYNSNFQALVANDTELVALLKGFTEQEWMLGSDSEYLIANAAKELGRLKLYGGAIETNVNTALTNLFSSSYQLYGYGDAVWLGAADTATYYGDCSDYGICGYLEQLEAQVLSQVHVCSPTIKIRSQDLTPLQQDSACDTMEAEETYFHSKLQTDNSPIPGDNNVQLQVNIFDSSNDYGKYAGHIFGINTNNGGMYLEGNPSNVGNVPNFIAYEASYAEADHYIWNLEHEYVHYLDGRFNLQGDFNSPTEDIVWWSEGIAEYVAKQNDNPAAIDTIFDGSTYSLAEVFATNYDGFDQDRIYRWGYLAVRFMFEKHFSEVKAMIAETRAGNWSAYKTRTNNWATNYGSEFTAWTQTLNSTPNENIAPVAVISGNESANVNVDINFSGAGSTDADGNITNYVWDFGDGNTSFSASTAHSYTSAGNYTVRLTVTDDDGATNTTTSQVTINDVPTSNSLVNKQWLNITGDEGSETVYSISVPAGSTGLRFDTSGGTGDADLYVKFGAQPTTQDYDCRPYRSGNTEMCEIGNAQPGTYYVMVRGYNAYQTFLMASFDVSTTMVDACATQSPISSGRVEDDQAVCLDQVSPIWLSVGDLTNHSSMTITTGNGTGNLDLEFSNSGWPNGSNVDGSSSNSGNNECIFISNLSEYWGYIKVTGDANNASLVVRFDSGGCN